MDEYVTPCLQTVTPLTYLPLLSDAALADEGFAAYSFLGGGLVE